MSWPGWVGLSLMGLGLLLVVFASLVTLPRALRFWRRVVALRELLAQGGGAVIEELEEFAILRQEREALLRPYTRLRRYLAHPLTVALAQSYLHRRRTARR